MAQTYLVLEDGTVYEGTSFGYETEAYGEVVFSTEECGYQKSLTDPSYRGHIVVMTYPLIGNYLVHDEWFHSDRVQASAVIVKEYCRNPSTMYPGITFDQFLKDNKVPGITGIDTRDLTLRIRDNGSMKGAVTQKKDEVESLVKKLKSMPLPSEGNLVAEVSPTAVKEYDEGKEITVGIVDCGEMKGTVRALRARYNVVRFPYDTPADVIANYKLGSKKVQGVVFSNGPGNPAHPAIMKSVVPTFKALSTQMPIFAIGLGNQIAAIAMGGEVYKMKFGHHGVNEPVMYGGRTYITAQNHIYAVDEKSLEGTGLIADQFNVNDHSVEGMRHESLPIYTAQYLPETTSEPWETSFLYDRFGQVIKEGHL